MPTPAPIKKFIKYFLGKKALQPLYSFLFLAGLKGMNFGGGSDFKESGERWVLQYVANQNSGKNFCLFDVGANKGGYAQEAAAILKNAKVNYQIYCFEPSKATFLELQQNTKQINSLKIFNCALGEVQEQAQLYSNEAGSGLASLYQRDLSEHGIVLGNKEAINVDTLDNFCLSNKVEQINFLKLDVEGYEYKVLIGAKKYLDEKKINCIQFEFGGTDVDARVYFKDFFQLLSPNYSLFRILKNGLEPIQRYDESHEIFFTTNYLAVLKP